MGNRLQLGESFLNSTFFLHPSAICCTAREINTTRISTHSLGKTFVCCVYSASGNDPIRTLRDVGHSSPITASHLETDAPDLDRMVLTLDA